ncbi:hypothetical protein GCM10023317_32030 [Actinopolymorpha pittospori]
MATETGGNPSSDRVVSPNGAGEWDYLGPDDFTKQSRTFQSGGGDFMICLDAHSQHGSYILWEEDPFNPDDQVRLNDGLLNLLDFPRDFDSSGCYAFRGISNYVDGANDQAEFYVQNLGWGAATVYAYD